MNDTPSPESLRRAAAAVRSSPLSPFVHRVRVAHWLEELAREEEHAIASRAELDRVAEALTERLDQKRRTRKARQ